MLAAGRKHGIRPNVNVSVGCFVPKSFTPFQWFGFDGVGNLERKLAYLKDRFRSVKGVKLTWHEPKEAELEAIRARVGERMMTMTTVSWEWNHYGLFDVLCAMRAQGECRFAAFKAEAFAIADRGLVTSGTKDEFLAFAPPEDAQG